MKRNNKITLNEAQLRNIIMEQVNQALLNEWSFGSLFGRGKSDPEPEEQPMTQQGREMQSKDYAMSYRDKVTNELAPIISNLRNRIEELSDQHFFGDDDKVRNQLMTHTFELLKIIKTFNARAHKQYRDMRQSETPSRNGSNITSFRDKTGYRVGSSRAANGLYESINRIVNKEIKKLCR